MADVQLRYGLRVLWSGGAEMLGAEELQKTIDVCTTALDNQLLGLLDPKLFKQSMQQYCHGSYARLLKAIKEIIDKDQIKLSDVMKLDPKKLLIRNQAILTDVIGIGPRQLLRMEGFGDGSVLAAKKAFDDQLKPKGLPLPVRWQMAPSYFLMKAWET